eukprot:270553-Prorocentrum_minimum.AAC.1
MVQHAPEEVQRRRGPSEAPRTERGLQHKVTHARRLGCKYLGGESNSSVAEWLNKGLTAVWSP